VSTFRVPITAWLTAIDPPRETLRVVRQRTSEPAAAVVLLPVVERLSRLVNFEEVHLHDFAPVMDVRQAFGYRLG
jgi:hypothetical protein